MLGCGNILQLKKISSKLKSYGYKTIGPEIGDMACGEFGEGKMTEPKNILKDNKSLF